MIDPVLFISILCGATAITFGLFSRNLATAVVSGLFIGVIHAGLLALVAAQKAAWTLPELPYVKDGVDYAMNSGYLTFANARFGAYLAEIALATMILMVAVYLLRWIVLSILGLTPAQSRTA